MTAAQLIARHWSAHHIERAIQTGKLEAVEVRLAGVRWFEFLPAQGETWGSALASVTGGTSHA